MSRDFPQNQPPLSPTQRSNSVNLTEISNMQVQDNERQNHTYSRQNLSQTTQAFNEMKANYEELIGKFSNSPLSSGSGSSNSNNFNPNKSFPTYIGDISTNFLVDENAELEVQQWGIMWTHLVSMITQVIPYQQTNLNHPKSGNEKRAILVDLVSKLCENATNPKLAEDYNLLKKKYQKNKKSLKKLREQGESLMLEVKKNKEMIHQHLEKFNQNDDGNKLNQKIKQLEELLKKQVQDQAELLSMDLKRQNSQKNSKRFLPPQPQVQPQNIPLDILDQGNIIIEEEEEDIEDVVDGEARNLIKVVSNKVKIENHGTSKSPPKVEKINRSHRSRQTKEVEYEYEYSIDNNEYDSNSESEHDNIQQPRKVHRKQKQELTKHRKEKIILDQNRKRKHNQSRAKTQIQINDDDLFSSSSSSLSEEEKEATSKRSNSKVQPNQKQKKVHSLSKMNQTNAVSNNIQKNQKTQTKSTKSSRKTEKIQFQKNDVDLEEFNNNSNMVFNSNKRKRKDSPDLRMTKAIGNDINQLIAVTNSLKKYYNGLLKGSGNEQTCEMSIEQLSRIHDSLISAENQFDNISE